MDDVTAEHGLNVLIPPDSSRRKGPRPGWTSGRPRFMRHDPRQSRVGSQLYRQRKQTVEPVFAHTKHNRHINRFHRRGRYGGQDRMAADPDDPQPHQAAPPQPRRSDRLTSRDLRTDPAKRNPVCISACDLAAFTRQPHERLSHKYLGPMTFCTAAKRSRFGAELFQSRRVRLGRHTSSCGVGQNCRCHFRTTALVCATASRISSTLRPVLTPVEIAAFGWLRQRSVSDIRDLGLEDRTPPTSAFPASVPGIGDRLGVAGPIGQHDRRRLVCHERDRARRSARFGCETTHPLCGAVDAARGPANR